MPHLGNVFDTYERRARVYPVLLVVLPIASGGASWLPIGSTSWVSSAAP